MDIATDRRSHERHAGARRSTGLQVGIAQLRAQLDATHRTMTPREYAVFIDIACCMLGRERERPGVGRWLDVHFDPGGERE